jgi:hypothetical protein
MAVALVPALAVSAPPPGIALRAIAEGPVARTVSAATRGADAARPSTQALLHAVRTATAAIPTGALKLG